LVFERFAKRLQIATHHRYAWFGELWPLFLIVQLVGLFIISGPLTPTLIGVFVTSHVLAWQSLLAVGISCGILSLLSILLDEALFPFDVHR
jgi:hypothetical protein